MKTTNFEISKKLAEIGFKAKAEYYWHTINNKIELHHVARAGFGDYESYDLETLIEALPDCITREYKSREDGTIEEFKEKLLVSKDEIYYKCYDIETSDDANEYWREYGYEQNISIYSWNDSLVNIAGKMLIQLFEAGIINLTKK